MSSVLTSANPTLEVDSCNASEVAPAEMKSRGAEADVFKGATVTQVAYIPTPTMQATPGPAKDVTVGNEGAVNGMSATVILDPMPPPASADDDCTSVDTASTKKSSSTEGEGFASDVTWEEGTWKMLVRLTEDVGLAKYARFKGDGCRWVIGRCINSVSSFSLVL